MGLFSIFGTSLKALNAYSGALSVVANNVANSSNESYSRQTVAFETVTPDTIGGLEIGRGLDLGGINQIVDDFVESRLTDSIQKQGSAEASAEFLRSVDSIFYELDGTGLSDSISDFFDSWTVLSAEPSSIPARNNLLTSADRMVTIFNQYSTALTDLRNTIDNQIEGIVTNANSLINTIKDLNREIQESDTGGLIYQDERRKLVNELAELIDIRVVETGDNEFQIYTTTGTPLLNGVNAATLSTQPNVSNDNLNDIYVTVGGASSNITSSIQEGRLAGLLDVRDTKIDGYLDQLNQLAYEIHDEVNTLHTAGYDLTGTNGNDFFDALGSATNAAFNLALSADVDGVPAGIAISANAADVPGGNTVALNIAALADSTSINFNGTTNSFQGYFGDLLADIGSDSQLANNNESFQNNITDQVKLERIQISGVSVDEEEINLVKFQAAFQAAGRLVTIADTILSTLIDALG